MIPEDKVAEVRDRADIVALVREHVALKRAGSSFKGLCPFHNEKTPSFHVHPDRGFFHCFGCQVSGDAITFLMRIEGLAFPDAVRALAERVGVEITDLDDEEASAAREVRARRDRLLSVLESAAGFFVNSLDAHRFGEMAWAELSHRGIERATVERFRLGYAPHGWDELAQFLSRRGVSPRDAEQVGLIVPRKGGDGHYDRFRHRLMFPISDVHGKIVAFSGRALAAPPDEAELREAPAKYVNSPETALYKKGELLYGLHEARVELRREGVAFLCEGNFDVVALAQHGFANVVAPLGTAFTEAQAKLLRRFVASAVLLFDGDAAGHKAVAAAQPLLARAGVAGKVVTLPSGSDPDSFLRERGAPALRALVDQAPPIVEWLIERAAQRAGRDPAARAAEIEALGPVLAAIDSPVEARLYVERVAHAFEVSDIGAVRDQLRRGARGGGAPRRAPADAPAAPPAPREVRLPAVEAQIVGAFLDQPSLLGTDCAERVQPLLTSAELRAILVSTARWAGARAVDAPALLEEHSESPARRWLERRLAVQEFEDETSARRFVERAAPKLERDRVARETQRLRREFLEAKRAGDDVRAEALMRQMNESFRGAPRTGSEVER
ncbi:MAG: DNA primase [Sandaracinaceae bacterium]|nr:DNA primase [Sandaracinaceae bacterium]